MIKYLFAIFILCGMKSQAQESKQFTIEGDVKQKLTINLASLSNYKKVSIDSISILNHLLQRKSSIKNIKGVPLKEILSQVEINESSPKKLSEYYLVCSATDNYKVVFSWNEVFNAKSENNILILTDFVADPEKAEKGNIAMIATTDVATGRRFVKGLNKISIHKVN
ncbi:molybdopterin-binding protein [Pedobacter sp. MR22-3]|uniref:molybdopterin-binding protein n=1 Tax=Pedobacter sp. MR22-3 TaxID=2994552 RepID=UPI00224707D7|nr:molybdopterin-binding protein [Pedobacter sp. MR22-3]MCX2586331.1 molybdopterin-binding protein [Pedobacter sp. MR22-3]